MAEIGGSLRWFKYGILFSMLTCYMQTNSEAKTLQNSMTVGQRLEVSDTLRSKGGFFELGFFDPSPNSPNHYLGIWFLKAKTRMVVWVSNREYPFNNTSPVLTFEKDGNLATLDGNTTYVVTNVTVNDIKNTRVIMLDSGNLVMEDKNSTVLWESFDYPTDTLLAGMKLGYDNRVGKTWAIRSWRSPTDPGIGHIRMLLEPKGSGWTFVERSVREFSFAYGMNWIGNYINGSWSLNIENKEIIYNYSMPTKDYATVIYNYNKTDLFMIYKVDNNGQTNVLIWLQGYSDWVKLFSLPNRECDFYGYCGFSGVCNQQASGNPCYCLPGYEEISNDENNGGCRRITELKCSNTSVDYDDTTYHFIEVPQMTLPVRSEIHFGFASEQDCRKTCMRNCSCSGYSFKYSRCSLFIGNISILQRLPDKAPNAETLYVKVAVSDMNPKDNGNQPILTGWKLWITVITTLSIAIVSSSLFIYHFWKDKISQVEGKDLLSYSFEESSKDEPSIGEEHGRGITGYQIPLFKFSGVCAATDDFSASNKLGKGGFGAVYKGILNNGEEIAVKRLSKLVPGKESKEVKNEALLIAELRHDNLVRLLGCCLEGNENIIIYEYFQQRSLDLFLFDPKPTKKLDWENRTCIIHGIAAGLNYLHEYSRLQIIHGDLKANNILLDENMNPKITDFAMTRIYGANETLATNRMFGTSGYMSPEYASKGIVSNKSDVFGYGILVLEILSGKKNNFRTANSLNLLIYVWDLWNSNKALDLIDPTISESSTNIKRYIDIALLCVQENDNERPTMTDVVLYLGNEAMDLPTPKEPAFAKARALF
ncbi:G-type lectin S-receptor-like serine/threonine-protein kinase B120 [Euphorbia peplus]|nr:G-type lectin S-receptor-like serine/threonine-protein kinase B120 [Euphorbia peplus]